MEDEGLKAFVIIPDRIETVFRLWWEFLPSEHTVDVRFPHEKHGLTGQMSNNAKTEVKVDFLSFVDNNSQPNGRRSDSKNPTHYFLPKFKTISEPKSSVSNYEEKKMSLVSELNRSQVEAGKCTICVVTAISWLKAERPEVAIYPHQTDYCDFCVNTKDIQAHQQTMNRLLQSGSADPEQLQQCETAKKEAEECLKDHQEVARFLLEYCRDMTQKCTEQWKQIIALDSVERSPENAERLEELQNTFTLVLSAYYQMSQLLPYWGHSAQPSSTYYLQKVLYDIYGIVDHRHDQSHLYLLNETIGAKNTDHSFLYLLQSSGKVPSWVKRVHVFMENQYMMAAVFEIVQQ